MCIRDRDEQGFADLRDGHDDGGVAHRQRVLVGIDIGKIVQEGVAISVGQLQRRAQQHREHEEHRHVAILEQAERGQHQHVHQRAIAAPLAQCGRCLLYTSRCV